MSPKPQTLSQITNHRLDPNTELSLWFTTEKETQLVRTHFKSPAIPFEVCGVRGKTSGAFTTSATFQWTSAVQALSILLLRAASQYLRNSTSIEPLLEGGKGSLASSLDASIYKQVVWLDLFGITARGDSMSKRIFARTNPGRRRAGPVMIALNEKILPKSSITIFVDNVPTNNPLIIEKLAETIENTWNQEHLDSDISLLTIIPAIEKKKLAA